MTDSSFSRGPSHLQKKQVQVLLKGGQTLEGLVHIPEGLPLLNFLGGKRFFLNLTSVKRTEPAGEDEPLAHLSLRLSNVVWVVPMETSLHVSSRLAPTSASRAVELHLVDGLTLHVDLNIAAEQRMSDYLDANDGFIPLWSARVQENSTVFPRLAVNHGSILAIREIDPDD